MLFKGREYYLAAILIIAISIFLFMWSFEKRKPKTREVVVLAVMTGIESAVGLHKLMPSKVSSFGREGVAYFYAVSK